MAQEGEAVSKKRSRAWRARTAAMQVREVRGDKQRVEFNLPNALVLSMKEIAGREGKSMTQLLLETLQRGDERLGIGDAHFVDLRRRLPAGAMDAAIRGPHAVPPG